MLRCILYHFQCLQNLWLIHRQKHHLWAKSENQAEIKWIILIAWYQSNITFLTKSSNLIIYSFDFKIVCINANTGNLKCFRAFTVFIDCNRNVRVRVHKWIRISLKTDHGEERSIRYVEFHSGWPCDLQQSPDWCCQTGSA